MASGAPALLRSRNMSATSSSQPETVYERWLPALLLLGALAGPGLGLVATWFATRPEPAPQVSLVAPQSECGSCAPR